MAKLTLTDISSGYSSKEAINDNNTAIETAVENTLSRDGTGPNQMEANFDMNGYRILNLPDAVDNSEPVTLSQAGTIAGVTNPLTRTSVGTVLYPQTSAETSASVTPTNYYYEPGDIRRYGATTGAADNSTAIQNAISVATSGGGAVFIPPGSWTCTTSVQMESSVQLYGLGDASHLSMSGCSIVVSGVEQAAHVDFWKMKGIRVSRTGSAGPAIQLTGDDTSGSNEGAIRGYLEDVYVDDSTGTGIEFSNAYIIYCVNVFLRNTDSYALDMKLGPQGLVSANAITFYGGEIQACAQAAFMDSVANVSFFGTTQAFLKSIRCPRYIYRIWKWFLSRCPFI